MALEDLKKQEAEIASELDAAIQNGASELDIALLKEKKLGLSHNIKSLTAGGRARHTRYGNGESWAHDKKQLADWVRENDNHDDEINDVHAAKLHTIKQSVRDGAGEHRIPDIIARMNGTKLVELAEKKNVATSTVCRNLKRASARVSKLSSIRSIVELVKDPQGVLDANDPRVFSLLMAPSSPKQMALFYLNKCHDLSLKEISDMVGVEKSTVLRNCNRVCMALKLMIGDNYGDIRIKNIGRIETVAYELYHSGEIDLTTERDSIEVLPRVKVEGKDFEITFHVGPVDTCLYKELLKKGQETGVNVYAYLVRIFDVLIRKARSDLDW